MKQNNNPTIDNKIIFVCIPKARRITFFIRDNENFFKEITFHDEYGFKVEEKRASRKDVEFLLNIERNQVSEIILCSLDDLFVSKENSVHIKKILQETSESLEEFSRIIRKAENLL